MKLLFTYGIMLFLLPIVAYPCINESRVLLSGEVREDFPERDAPYGHKWNREEIQARLSRLETAWKANHQVNDYLDCGVMHVYLGNYEKARTIFTEIEAKYPGKYTTAANLGTTYELLGNNEQALKWITEAVRRNPKSHYGSEWIHVNILKAKLEGKKAITSQFLLGTSFGKKDIPVSTLTTEQLVKLRDALHYQLNERISFVKAPDPIVGLLLFELGNIVAITDDVTTALKIYNQAKKYGYASPVLTRRYEKFRQMNKIVEQHPEMAMMEVKNDNIVVKRSWKWWGIGTGVAVVLVLGGMVVYSRKKRRMIV